MASLAEGELVQVRWTKGKGALFEAVVNETSDKGVRVCIDGPDESHPLSGCAVWVETDRVQPLPAAERYLPEWASCGRRVRAPNPASATDVLEEASVLAARQGLKRGEAGVRLHLRFESGVSSWVRLPDVEEPLPSSEGDATDRGQAAAAEVDESEGTQSAAAGAEAPAAEEPVQPQDDGEDEVLELDDSETEEDEPEAETEEDEPEVAPTATEPAAAAAAAAAAASDEAAAASPERSVVTPAAADVDTWSDDGEGETEEATQLATCEVKVEPEPPKRVQEEEVVEEEATQEQDEAGEEEEEQQQQGEEAGDDDDSELEENDAVVVLWGKKGHNAVVTDLKPRRPKGVRVQFDADNAHAWVTRSAVRPMALAEEEGVPSWVRPGCHVQAVDPHAAKRVWHDADVEEVRRGIEADERGLRIWLRYRASKMCQWLHIDGVREPRAGADGGDDDDEGEGEGTAATGGGAKRATSRKRASAEAAPGARKRAANGAAGAGEELAAHLDRWSEKTLRSALKDEGLPTAGSKEVLCARLLKALSS